MYEEVLRNIRTRNEAKIKTSRHEEEQKKKTVVDVKNFSFGSAPLSQEGRVYDARIGRRASEKYKYNG